MHARVLYGGFTQVRIKCYHSYFNLYYLSIYLWNNGFILYTKCCVSPRVVRDIYKWNLPFLQHAWKSCSNIKHWWTLGASHHMLNVKYIITSCITQRSICYMYVLYISIYILSRRCKHSFSPSTFSYSLSFNFLRFTSP